MIWKCFYCGKKKPSSQFAWIRGFTHCCKLCDKELDDGLTRQRRHQLRTGYNTKFPGIDVGKIVLRDASRCYLCGKFVKPRERSLDHVIPKSKGGPTTYENLRLAHRRCNSRKGAKFVTVDPK